MAQRLPCLFLAAALLLLAARRGDAQPPGQPMPPTAADKPKPSEPPPEGLAIDAWPPAVKSAFVVVPLT